MPQTAEKNKAVKIRALLEAGYSTTAAAEIVGCCSGYARAVKQRMHKHYSVWTKYDTSRFGDREQARAAGREAARSGGRYDQAYRAVLRSTGRAVLRSQRENAA